MAEDILTINHEGKDVTITMYAGVLGKVGKAIGGPVGLDKIAYDIELQEKLVDTVLTKYDEQGNEVEKYIPMFKLSTENFATILSWGVEHYSLFIVKSSRNMLEKMSKLQAEMDKAEKTLKATNNG